MHTYSLNFKPTDDECQEARRLLDDAMVSRTRQIWDYDTVTAPLLGIRNSASHYELAGLIDLTATPLETKPPEIIPLRDCIDAITDEEDGIDVDAVAELLDHECCVKVPISGGGVVESDTYRWIREDDRRAARSLRNRIEAAYEQPGCYQFHFSHLLSHIGFGLPDILTIQNDLLRMGDPDADPFKGGDPLKGVGEALVYLEQERAKRR